MVLWHHVFLIIITLAYQTTASGVPRPHMQTPKLLATCSLALVVTGRGRVFQERGLAHIFLLRPGLAGVSLIFLGSWDGATPDEGSSDMPSVKYLNCARPHCRALPYGIWTGVGYSLQPYVPW